MRGIGCCGSIRYRAHAGFVGEEAAFDTGHQGDADCSTGNGIKAEGFGHDHEQNAGHFGDVHDKS